MERMNKDPQSIVASRMAQAREALTDGLILMGVSDKTGRAAVNRAYFAAYYAVLGAMAALGADLEPDAEKEMLGLFEREFVKTGKIGTEAMEIIRKLSDLRHDTEWKRLEPVGAEEAKKALEESSLVYNAISGYLFAEGLMEETDTKG